MGTPRRTGAGRPLADSVAVVVVRFDVVQQLPLLPCDL